jgi:ISXO2 transposase-like protein
VVDVAQAAPRNGRARAQAADRSRAVDDFYVGGHEKDRPGGRYTDSSKAIVAAAVELRGSGSGRLRMAVIPDLSADALCGFVSAVVDPGAVVHSDGWQGYKRLSRLGFEHYARSQRALPTGVWVLPRVHRSISNLKAWLHGTYRDVSREHLQVYSTSSCFGTTAAAHRGLGSDLARPRNTAPAHHLPTDHQTRCLTATSQPDTQDDRYRALLLSLR